MKLEPGNAEATFRLGVVLDKQGQRPAALEQMQKAIDLDDRHARALNYLGYSLAEEGPRPGRGRELHPPRPGRGALRGLLHPGQPGLGLL